MKRLAMIPVLEFSYSRRVSAACTWWRRWCAEGRFKAASGREALPGTLTPSATCAYLCFGRRESVVMGAPGGSQPEPDARAAEGPETVILLRAAIQWADITSSWTG